MKLTCQKSELYEVLPNVAKATSVKTPMEALAAIRLQASGNELSLTGYDLELGIRTQITANVEEEGVLLTDSRLFSELVRRMPEGVILIETDDRLKITISGGGTSCQLPGMHADEYPELPDIENQQGILIPQYLLKNMIEQTIYAVSLDETKPIFTGELIEISDDALNIVALDNYRMALRTEPLPGMSPIKFVVPAKALREIQHLLSDDDKSDQPCAIRLDQHHAMFEIRNYVVYTRLLAGDFINYRRSIPENGKIEVFVNRRELIDSLERCGLLISEKNKTPVRFQLDAGTLMVNCQNAVGSVDDQLSCDMTGEKLIIGFNNRYLLEAVRAVQGDRVRLLMSASDRAVKIMEADGEGSIAVVMPVQVRR